MAHDMEVGLAEGLAAVSAAAAYSSSSSRQGPAAESDDEGQEGEEAEQRQSAAAAAAATVRHGEMETVGTTNPPLSLAPALVPMADLSSHLGSQYIFGRQRPLLQHRPRPADDVFKYLAT
jgi:hypothetical protein